MRRSSRVLAAAAAVAIGGVVAAPRAARAFKTWEDNQRKAWYAAATAALARGEETLPPLPFLVGIEQEGDTIEKDDPTVRGFFNALLFGARTPEYQHELLQIAAAEARKSAAMQAQLGRPAEAAQIRGADGTVVSPTPATALSWDNLGPAFARSATARQVI